MQPSPVPAQAHPHTPVWPSAIMWVFFTLLFVPVCFMAPGIFSAARGASELSDPWIFLSWLLILIPGAPILYGWGLLQQLALRTSSRRERVAQGWALRTLIGGEIGIALYLVVLWLLKTLYYGGPLFSFWGIVIPMGDPIEVGGTVAGWALFGASLGIAQRWPSRPDQQDLWESASWTLSSALSWAAGAVASWTLFKFYVIGYEPICISCIMRLIECAILSALVIALAGGLALLNRFAGIALSLAVFALAAFLLPNSPTPAFSPRHIHPVYVLERDGAFVESVAFSDDGQLLASVKADYWMGEITEKWVLLWRTSDWKLLGTVPADGTSAHMGELRGEPVTAQFIDSEHKLLIQRKSDGFVANTVDFGSAYPWPPLPPQYTSFIPPSGYEEGSLLTTDGTNLVMNPLPVESYHSPNQTFCDIAPSGKYIACGYHFGGIWVWRVP